MQLYNFFPHLQHRLWFFVLIFLQNCATDIPPTGGPEDKTPPKIVSIFPDSGSVGVKTDRLQIRFDKYMTTSSLSKALFFSPQLTDFEIEWDGGKEATVILYEPLKANQTYAYTITRSVSDSRGNGLEKSYTFAFSTGSTIDSGYINGVVYDQHNRLLKGATIFAYALPENHASSSDTLNPSKTKPDYIAQTSDDGSFALHFLRSGTYKLFAIIDKNQNLLYDEGEKFAIPYERILTNKDRVRLRLTERDTLAIELQSANAITSNTIALRFDRNINTDSLSIEQFALFDSTNKQEVKLFDFYSKPEGERMLLHLVTETILKEHRYQLQLWGIHDFFHNISDTLSTGFVGIDERDTTRATLSIQLPDSTTAVFERIPPSPYGKRLPLSFNVPIQRASLNNALILIQQKDTLNINFFFHDARHVDIMPTTEFKDGTWYQLVIQHANILDVLGRKTIDTTYTIHFQTAGSELFGEMEGQIIIDTIYAKAPMVCLSAELVGERKFYREVIPIKAFSPTCEFKFVGLPEGKYFLSAFIPDVDLSQISSSGNTDTSISLHGSDSLISLNRKEKKFINFSKDSTPPLMFRNWDGGSLLPYKLSEPFFISLDSIRIRKRWTTDGIQFRLN